jgi:hypothetical protein
MIPDELKTYWDVVLAERSWSWSLIGILYLGITLFLRSLLLSPIVRKAKDLNRAPYHEFRSAYLKRAAVGWVFFLASFLIVIGLWSSGSYFPLTVKEALAILGAMLSYILSILFHLQALGIAAVIALKQMTEKAAGV